MAAKRKIKSIAFPNISTGAYGYPKEEAAQIAISTVKAWLKENPDTSLKEIIFISFSNEDYQIYKRILGARKEKTAKEEKKR